MHQCLFEFGWQTHDASDVDGSDRLLRRLEFGSE